MNDVMRFESIQLIEIPVELGNAKYVLREATGAVACRYRDALLSNTQLGSDGKASIKINNEVEALLVSLSIFDEDRQPVSLETVKGWPSRIVKALYSKVKAISELDEAATTPSTDEQGSAGNVPEGEKMPPKVTKSNKAPLPKSEPADITDG